MSDTTTTYQDILKAPPDWPHTEQARRLMGSVLPGLTCLAFRVRHGDGDARLPDDRYPDPIVIVRVFAVWVGCRECGARWREWRPTDDSPPDSEVGPCPACKPTIVRMVQTCFACPSQWDGWDASGVYFYFRYRHGHLSVTRHAFSDGETTVFSESIGEGLGGCMTYDELREHLRDVLVLPEACE